MYTDSDGSSDSEEELSQFNLLGTDTVPTALAVTRYDNELFNNDDLDEVELGADLSSSVDTERSGNSTVLSSTLDDRATQLEQIKDLAARRRKEKLLFRCTVSSNDFVLPRTSLTEGRRWGAGPLLKGPVSSCGGSWLKHQFAHSRSLPIEML